MFSCIIFSDDETLLDKLSLLYFRIMFLAISSVKIKFSVSLPSLSRKTEGIGPMMSWQPDRKAGANSYTHRVKDELSSSFLKAEIF